MWCNYHPNRGAWLEFESDVNENIYVRIDRTRKIPVTALIEHWAMELI